MRLFPASLLCVMLTLASVKEAATAQPAETFPSAALPIRFTMMGPNEAAMQNQQQRLPPGYAGSYTPVAPQQPYQRACGTVATDICPVAATIPPGATGEQVFNMAKAAEANHRKGEALWLLQKSAELGYMDAQGTVGINDLKGIGIPAPDPVKGVYWMDLAARQGSAKSAMYLGVCLEDGSNNVRQDEPRAIAYFKQAAAQHQSLAEYRLGLDYEIGRGLPHNRALALEYLRRAASDGQTMAGTTANFLAKSKAPQFQSIDDIDSAMSPKPQRTAGNTPAGCPAWYDSTWSGSVGSLINISGSYCIVHPNCQFHVFNQTYTCDGDKTTLHRVP